jgi:hypothetical protein
MYNFTNSPCVTPSMLVHILWYNVAAANPRSWERMPAAAYLAQLTGDCKMAHADAARWLSILMLAGGHGVACKT